MKQEENIKNRKSILNAIDANKEMMKKSQGEMTNSSFHTKLELPILYSNLITIEDMKFENSHYYIRSNGFLNSNLKLSSERYDRHFNYSDCVFRVFPKTYNMNKYKVLDYIQSKTKGTEGNEEEINFKFESEMFNNLDIVESKFGEPVRYGDIIMLMHENSQKLIKYNPEMKKLVLSNHDSEFTLFSVEPHCEIMLNDDLILKSGQPIKLKVASFIYADKKLLFSLHFPYEESTEQVKTNYDKRNVSNTNIIKQEDEGNSFSSQSNSDESPDCEEEEEEEEREIFDKQAQKYHKDPELIIEEDSNMRWRFNLFSTFTIDETLLVYGDFVNILHCDSNACLTVEQIQIETTYNKNRSASVIKQSSFSHSLKTSLLLLNESEISNDQAGSNIKESITDVENEDLLDIDYSINSKFFLKKFNIKEVKIDVNSTWIIENIFPSIKNICFVRFYDSHKLDTYRMTFRIQNFKTRKYLSIKKVENSETESELLGKVGLLKGVNGNSFYKFDLVDDVKNEDNHMLSEEYQYSLFGFHPNNRSSPGTENSFEYSSLRAEKNQFLKIFHVATKSYLKVLYIDDNKQQVTEDNLLKCVLTLTQHEEEHEVFKIISIDQTYVWNFRFLNNLFYLFKSIINHVTENMRMPTVQRKAGAMYTNFLNEKDENASSNNISENLFGRVKYKILKTTNFILDKLYKFITNQFINKFNSNHDYKSVVFERQNLIAKFGFTSMILREFIYDFWIDSRNMVNLKDLIKIIKKFNEDGEEVFHNLTRKEKVIYKMYKYTDSLFQFLILYCKDNPEIKYELYEHLDVFFYFFNLKESCMYCLIEIFKDNPKVQHALIRDCRCNPRFRKALVNIYKNYFLKRLDAEDEILQNQLIIGRSPMIKTFNLEEEDRVDRKSKSDIIKDSAIDEDLNLIDLVLEYVKISKFEKNSAYNNEKLLRKYISETSAISLISRDKYFELLKSLVYVENSNNILENQRMIIEKILINATDTEEDLSLVIYLEKKKDQLDYPPCLSELLVSLADQNPDPNILRFLKKNFTIERLFSSNSNNIPNIINDQKIPANNNNANYLDLEYQNGFNQELLAVNLKLISFFITAVNNTKLSINEEYKSFSKKVTEFYKKVIESLEQFFDSDKKNKFNYSDKSEVNALISIIQFIKTVYANDMVNETNTTNINNLKKHEKKLITNLMYFITNSYYLVHLNKKFSSVLQESMNKKQLAIKERIVKSDHTNYLSIAKSWLNVYLVFRNKLSKLVEEESRNVGKSSVGILNRFARSKAQSGFGSKPTMAFGKIKLSKKEMSMRVLTRFLGQKNQNRSSLQVKNEEDDEKSGLISGRVKRKGSSANNRYDDSLNKNHISTKKQFVPKFNEHKDNVISLFQNKIETKLLDFYSPDDLDVNKKKKIEEAKYLEDEDNYFNPFDNNFTKTNYFRKAKKSTLFINEDYIERLKSTNYPKGFFSIKSNMLDYEFHTKNENFIEDEKRRNKNEIMKNIFNLFQLFLKKNISVMIDNFVNFFNHTSIGEHTFSDFLGNCVPTIESEDINYFLQNYSEIESSHTSIKRNLWLQNLSNLNLLFENKHDPGLNFIHNLMISFNIIDDLDIQEEILNLIYKYFSQRKKFFKKMMLFNEHLISVQNKDKDKDRESSRSSFLSNDRNSIKSNFIKFFSNYEKNKHRFSDENLMETGTYYSNLQGEISVLFKKILITIKHELKTVSSENIKKIFENKDENDSLMEEIDKYLNIMNEIEKNSTGEKGETKTYRQMFDDLITFFYFIRNNLNNSIVGSVSWILSQNQNIFNQFDFSLFRDFLEKGKKLHKSFLEKDLKFLFSSSKDEKEVYTEQRELVKRRYFYCFSMLIILLLISIPRNKKSIDFLKKIIHNNKELLSKDANTSFIILLAYSDLQKENFSLNYYVVMEHMKNFKQVSNLQMSNGLTNLYLDILKNVLKYIVENDKIIAESNLDEIIVDNVIFLLKRIELSFYQSEEIIKLLSVLAIVMRVDSLCKILKIKIENPDEAPCNNYLTTGKSDKINILEKFPKPDEILELFEINFLKGIGEEYPTTPAEALRNFLNKNSNLINPNTLQGNLIIFLKNAYTIYKYILLYLSEINTNYFDDSKEKEMVRELVQCVFYGYSYFTEEKKNGMESSSFLNGINFQNSPKKMFYQTLIASDFFVILNFYSLSFIKFGMKNLNYIEITELCFTNLTKVITDFVFKIESKDIVISFSKTFTIYKKTLQQASLAEAIISEKFYSFYFIIKKLQKFLAKGDIFKNFLVIIKHKKKLIQNEIKEMKLMKKDKCQKFKEIIWQNRKHIVALGNSEASCLVFYFLNLLKKEGNGHHEEILYTFISKVIDFIHKSTMVKCSSRSVKINNFFNFIIGEFISFFDDKTKIELNFLKKKSLKEIQLLFERTGIVKNGLQIICNHTSSEVLEQLPFIFDNLCMLLMKGNDMWQEIIYKNFTTNSEFELVYKFIYNLISDKMDSIVTNQSNIIRNKKKKIQADNFKLKFFNSDSVNKLDSKVLQFMQLLCENHNRKLQLFLHHQENLRKSYDLVSLTNVYLQVLYANFEKHLFDPLLKCFDLLIEFIQGPCLQNQLAMINSKLLITISDILHLYLLIDDIGKKHINYTSDASNKTQEYAARMNPLQISLLVYKCSILLLALIEARRKEDKIYDQVILNIKPELINAVYDKTYFQHVSNLENSYDEGDFIIRIRDLNRAEEVIDNMKKDCGVDYAYDVSEYLIVETGFNLYFLHQYINDYQLSNSKEQTITKKSKTFAFLKEDRNILSLFIMFFYDLFISIAKFLSLIISSLTFVFTLGRKKVSNVIIKLFRKRIFKKEDSVNFYSGYTKSIEILRDEIVYKFYFFYYPFLSSFKSFEKNSFLEGMDRTNSKTKLMDILKFSNKLKFELEYDYKVKRFLSNIPAIGVVFKHIELWKDFSLFLTLIQNFFNIAAYFKRQVDKSICLDPSDCFTFTTWVDDKIYFDLSGNDFQAIINKLAILQTSLAGIIVLEFFFRKTAAIFKEIEEEMSNLNYSTNKRRFFYVKESIKRIVFNFQVIYYLCYITAALLGYITVDFYFAFLLLEVVTRFKTLKNVMMAIRNPIKELFLTFLLWIILIYYFAVIAYSFFRYDFIGENECSSLSRCLATIFYQNNKNDNGISLHMTPMIVNKDNKNPVGARFWYDQLFNLIVKILIIQMVAGIIIDNFAKLRKEEADMICDMNNVCTICGLKKEDIEKVYDKYGRSYQDHINKDHNVFNYIYFIIYLYKKDKTEFSGMESYVYEMVFLQKDITWFPINKMYIAKEEELDDLLEKSKDNNKID